MCPDLICPLFMHVSEFFLGKRWFFGRAWHLFLLFGIISVQVSNKVLGLFFWEPFLGLQGVVGSKNKERKNALMLMSLIYFR